MSIYTDYANSDQFSHPMMNQEAGTMSDWSQANWDPARAQNVINQYFQDNPLKPFTGSGAVPALDYYKNILTGGMYAGNVIAPYSTTNPNTPDGSGPRDTSQGYFGPSETVNPAAINEAQRLNSIYGRTPEWQQYRQEQAKQTGLDKFVNYGMAAEMAIFGGLAAGALSGAAGTASAGTAAGSAGAGTAAGAAGTDFAGSVASGGWGGLGAATDIGAGAGLGAGAGTTTAASLAIPGAEAAGGWGGLGGSWFRRFNRKRWRVVCWRSWDSWKHWKYIRKQRS